MERETEKRAAKPLEDAEIIQFYQMRDERAIEETDVKYGKYLFSVAYNLLHDMHDSEECLNDTYLGAWNSIPPTLPRVLRAFLAVIARRVSIKRYRMSERQSEIPRDMRVSMSELDELLADVGDVSAELDSRELGALISDFIRSLSPRRQFIFMSRYYGSEQISVIAGELGISRSSVNKELAAIRCSLKERLEREGYMI